MEGHHHLRLGIFVIDALLWPDFFECCCHVGLLLSRNSYYPPWHTICRLNNFVTDAKLIVDIAKFDAIEDVRVSHRMISR
jgi:hypothetical protein